LCVRLQLCDVPLLTLGIERGSRDQGPATSNARWGFFVFKIGAPRMAAPSPRPSFLDAPSPGDGGGRNSE
jgi:hypothetical protein